MRVSSTKTLTDAELALVKQELLSDPNGVGYKDAGGNWKSLAEIARLLTQAPMVPNPVSPQPTILKPINKAEFLNLMLPAIGSFSDEALVRVSEAADSDDRATISLWLTIALQRTWIDQTLHDTLAAKLAETYPDPSWAAQVPGQSPLERVLGRKTGIGIADVNDLIT